MMSITYYGYAPGEHILTRYRLVRNDDGLMVSLEGANATTSWSDAHGAFQAIEQDPQFRELRVDERKESEQDDE